MEKAVKRPFIHISRLYDCLCILVLFGVLSLSQLWSFDTCSQIMVLLISPRLSPLSSASLFLLSSCVKAIEALVKLSTLIWQKIAF